MSDAGDAQEAWAQVWAWNDAIADEQFSEGSAGTPVYLDVDDGALARLAARVGPEAENDPRQALVRSIKRTLDLPPEEHNIFRPYAAVVREWKVDQQGPPPCLALLSVLTLAADAMHSDATMGANNYYGRLSQILELGQDHSGRVAADYRQVSDVLWTGLVDWLELHEGERGLPTAHPLTFKHVGWPLSQALVRSGDRRRLRAMFADFGLPPGYQISAVDMERLLAAWIPDPSTPVSNTLRRLWQRDPKARERIAAIAALELEAWDGSTFRDAVDGKTASQVHLMAVLRRFLGHHLEFNLLVRGTARGQHRELELLDPDDGTPLDKLQFVPAPDGALRLADPTVVEASSMISAQLRLRDAESGEVAERRPRGIVPLRKDDLLQAHVEAERVQLGDSTMLLCRPHLVQPLRVALEGIARPGWRELADGVEGLPQDWVLFTDVHVLSVLPPGNRRFELNALTPLATSQLTVADGLQLPGRVRKWSSHRPPEVRAVSEHAEVVTVHLEPLRTFGGAPAEPRPWKGESAALVVDLAEEALPDGDYQLRLLEDDATAPATETLLRLRSADTIAQDLWTSRPRLVHHTTSPFSALGAKPLDEVGGETYIEGASVQPEPTHVDLPSAVLPDRLARRSVALEPQWVQPISLGRPTRQSCIVTGAHYIDLPTLRSSRPQPGTIEGMCRSCGMKKRYPGTHGAAVRKARKAAEAAMADRIHVDQVTPVSRERDPGWEDAFDGACHVGGGSIGQLERLALQIEGSNLVVATFIRNLDWLGHIDVELDEASLQPIRWEVAPTTLAELPDGRHVLTGYRSRSLTAHLGKALAQSGGRLRRQQQSQGPDAVFIDHDHPQQVQRITSELFETTGLQVHVAPQAARQMANLLPPISSLLSRLPKMPLPAWRSAERWNVQSARWAPAHHVEEPGAYRLRGFSTTYLLRTEDDLHAGFATLTGPHLAKHLMAQLTGHPLLAYDEAEGVLITALGADLPGLYGRAAVLCSGRLPAVDERRQLLLYRDVPKNIAQAMAHHISR